MWYASSMELSLRRCDFHTGPRTINEYFLILLDEYSIGPSGQSCSFLTSYGECLPTYHKGYFL